MKTYLVILLSILLAACGRKPADATQNAPVEASNNTVQLSEQQQKNAGIVTENARQKSISSVLKVSGRIDVPPQNMISISVPLGGYLRSTKLLPGMQVRKGEVIAVMEDQQYIQLQQDYLTGMAKLSFLENDYARQKELNAGKASSDKLLQQTEADYKSQKILVKSMQERLKLIGIDPSHLDENTLSRSIVITAPIDAFVSKVNVNIGKYVVPSEVMFELVNPSDIHLALTVFEKDLSKLHIGQKLEAYTNYDEKTRYACEIILISQNLDADRSADVHCHFEKYDKTLIPGMYMNADIQVRTDSGYVLPDEAVVLFKGKNYVFMQTAKNEFKMEEVRPGISANGYTEITALPDRTARYITKGAYTALMSLKNRAED